MENTRPNRKTTHMRILVALKEDHAAALVAGGEVLAVVAELNGGDDVGWRSRGRERGKGKQTKGNSLNASIQVRPHQPSAISPSPALSPNTWLNFQVRSGEEAMACGRRREAEGRRRAGGRLGLLLNEGREGWRWRSGPAVPATHAVCTAAGIGKGSEGGLALGR